MKEEISSSKFQDSLNCPTYFRYSWDLAIKPRQPGLALAYGSAIHAALAEYFRGRDFRHLLQAFDDVWTKESQGRDDNKRNATRGLEILRAFWQSKCHRDSVIAVEAPFIVPLTDDLIWTGVIDLVEKLGGHFVVTDHKTSSLINNAFWAKFAAQASYQPISYCRAAGITMNHPITMYSINAILVNDKKTLFERRFYSVNPSIIDQLPSIITAHWKSIQYYREASCWPKKEEYCNRWGECVYLPLCGSAGIDYTKEESLERLPADYIIAPWDNVRQLRH